MKNILWFKVLLAGIGVEITYGVYISFIRWYEESIISSFIALALLMLIGGFWVANKALSNKILHGALVGLTGVAFYLIVTSLLANPEEIYSGLQFWIEHLAKIGGGAIGGFIAGRKDISNSNS